MISVRSVVESSAGSNPWSRRTEVDGGGGVEPGDADEVVDVDPFGDGMLAAGAGPMGDRGDATQGGEAVAVVDERLGAGGQGCAGDRPMTALERGDEGIGRIEREAVTDEHPAGLDRGVGVGGEPVEASLEVAGDGGGIGAGQPAPSPFQPGLLGVL